MWYAVRLCGNPNHERYQRPIEFIVEGDGDGDDPYEMPPLERETESGIRKALKGHMLYEAGWVKVIEIDETETD